MALTEQVQMYSLDTTFFHFEDEESIYREIQERNQIKKEILKPQFKSIEAEILKHNKKLNNNSSFVEYNKIKKELKRRYEIRQKYRDLKYHKVKNENHNMYDENENKISELRKSKKELRVEVENLDFMNPRLTDEFIALDENNKEMTKLKQELTKTIKNNKRRKRVLNKDIGIKNIVSIFKNGLTRTIEVETNTLTTDIVTVRIYYYDILKSFMAHGFEINGEDYVFFSASAGMIRTKKCEFIKKSTLEKHSKRIYCGLDLDKINTPRKKIKDGEEVIEIGCNKNKFLAYSSLISTASDVWDDFDIDRAIVVDDFETIVNGMVDYIDYNEYDENNLWKITRKNMDITIPTMDGCGICTSYTGMFRLPWCKGLFAQFPIVNFIKLHRKIEKENNPDLESTKIGKVKDIYGKEYDIISDNIKYILTKSQFKMWKYYKDWDEYKECFKKYGCEACKCNEDNDNPSLAKISYQPLQTLYDMTDDEILELLKDTNESICNIGNDKNSILKVLGADTKNNKKNSYQKAIELYPEMINDKYTKRTLLETKESMVNNARYGKIRIDGSYFFVLPDVYAFAEWLFLHIDNPNGLLEDGQVSCKSYDNDIEVGMIRSPHLNFSHCINKNVINDDTKKWYKSNGVYTSCHSLYSLVLMCDWDGDSVMLYKNPVLINVAKRIREKHDIVPLYYELKKAKDDFISNDTLYQGMIDAYSGGNIGEVSNSICKIWNNGEIGEDELRAINYLTLWNNVVIDYAKTLWKPDKSEEMELFLKQYTRKKLPFFFKYIADKNKTEDKLEKANNSVVNRLTYLVENPDATFTATNCGEFDYTKMLNNKEIKTNSIIAKKTINTFKYWNMNKKYILNEDDKGHKNFKNEFIRRKTVSWIQDEDEVLDILIKYYYHDIDSDNKRTLWEIFGETIIERLNKELPSNSEVCDVCGKRFVKENPKSTGCSNECKKILLNKAKLNWWHKNH